MLVASGLAVSLLAVLPIAALSGCTSTSSPRPSVTVPTSAANAYPADAEATLCKAGLHPLFVRAPVINHADGNVNGYAVRSLSPRPGQATTVGMTVTVELNESFNGGGPWPAPPRHVRLPSVIGMGVNAAVRRLTGDGLHADVRVAAPTGELSVSEQTPSAGKTMAGGSTVTLGVGRAGSPACS